MAKYIWMIFFRLKNFVKLHWARLSVAVAFVVCVWPYRYAPHYPYITVDDIHDELIEKLTTNLTQQVTDRINCEYDELILGNQYLYREPYISNLLDGSDIRVGGEWSPSKCAPKFSTAVIVVYRQREKQLKAFLTYIHNFLRKQQIHYRIFVIEQYDQKPFNRATLFNIGSVYASQFDFPCLILHDVDLMPMNLGNLYACTKRPRHMCSSLDKFRFNLPYYGLFGGVVSIETSMFQLVNGMSNMVCYGNHVLLRIRYILYTWTIEFLLLFTQFIGWGGEDDDLFERLRGKNIDICRFAPKYSRYTMLKHAKEIPNENRYNMLRNGSLRFNTDGLSSLEFKEKEIKLHKLFTHILVLT